MSSKPQSSTNIPKTPDETELRFRHQFLDELYQTRNTIALYKKAIEKADQSIARLVEIYLAWFPPQKRSEMAVDLYYLEEVDAKYLAPSLGCNPEDLEKTIGPLTEWPIHCPKCGLDGFGTFYTRADFRRVYDKESWNWIWLCDRCASVKP